MAEMDFWRASSNNKWFIRADKLEINMKNASINQSPLNRVYKRKLTINSEFFRYFALVIIFSMFNFKNYKNNFILKR